MALKEFAKIIVMVVSKWGDMEGKAEFLETFGGGDSYASRDPTYP